MEAALTDVIEKESPGSRARRDIYDLRETPRRCINSFNSVQKCLTRMSWGGSWDTALLEKFGMQEKFHYFKERKLVKASIRAINDRAKKT